MFIKQKAEEKLNIVLKNNRQPDGITGYYLEAMRKEIYETPIDLLNYKEKARARELLFAYFENPSFENAEKLRVFSTTLASYNPQKGGELTRFVATISLPVWSKLIA